MHSPRTLSRRPTHRERPRASRPTHRLRRSLAPTTVLLALCAVVAAGLLPGSADGLRSGGTNGAATAKLGVTYGPYLGKRCRHTAYPHCELIGVDIVFGRAATRVEAIAGAQRIRLRTPGKHSGVRRHDWVGTFTATDLARTHDSANRSGELL